jgi:hypothetical protein
MLSYLPLAHSFGRILEELALCVGAHIGYFRVRWGAGGMVCVAFVCGGEGAGGGGCE